MCAEAPPSNWASRSSGGTEARAAYSSPMTGARSRPEPRRPGSATARRRPRPHCRFWREPSGEVARGRRSHDAIRLHRPGRPQGAVPVAIPLPAGRVRIPPRRGRTGPLPHLLQRLPKRSPVGRGSGRGSRLGPIEDAALGCDSDEYRAALSVRAVRTAPARGFRRCRAGGRGRNRKMRTRPRWGRTRAIPLGPRRRAARTITPSPTPSMNDTALRSTTIAAAPWSMPAVTTSRKRDAQVHRPALAGRRQRCALLRAPAARRREAPAVAARRSRATRRSRWRGWTSRLPWDHPLSLEVGSRIRDRECAGPGRHRGPPA